MTETSVHILADTAEELGLVSGAVLNRTYHDEGCSNCDLWEDVKLPEDLQLQNEGQANSSQSKLAGWTYELGDPSLSNLLHRVRIPSHDITKIIGNNPSNTRQLSNGEDALRFLGQVSLSPKADYPETCSAGDRALYAALNKSCSSEPEDRQTNTLLGRFLIGALGMRGKSKDFEAMLEAQENVNRARGGYYAPVPQHALSDFFALVDSSLSLAQKLEVDLVALDKGQVAHELHIGICQIWPKLKLELALIYGELESSPCCSPDIQDERMRQLVALKKIETALEAATQNGIPEFHESEAALASVVPFVVDEQYGLGKWCRERLEREESVLETLANHGSLQLSSILRRQIPYSGFYDNMGNQLRGEVESVEKIPEIVMPTFIQGNDKLALGDLPINISIQAATRFGEFIESLQPLIRVYQVLNIQ